MGRIDSTLRIAGTTKESVVDGPGMRFVVYFQGCPHHCPGCHNPETWDFDVGKDIKWPVLLNEIKQNKILQGVTFSGGEPFAQRNILGLVNFAESIKNAGFDLTIYTGYTMEQIQSDFHKSLLAS